MSMKNQIRGNNGLLIALGLIGLILAAVGMVAAVYTAWLLAGLLAVQGWERFLVTVGILVLTSASVNSE